MNKKGLEYLTKFPKLRKWIVKCVTCGEMGYDLNLPSKITIEKDSLEVYYLKKYFKPLKVNELGMCEICEKIQKNR